MKVLERREEIEHLGASVVVVVHDSPARARAGLLRGLDVPWPVLVDESKEVYRRWGMGRASALRTWLAPRWVFDYAQAVLGRGERLLRPGRDVLQLGGAFVIGADGRVGFAAPQRRLDGRPPVALLLRELEGAG